MERFVRHDAMVGKRQLNLFFAKRKLYTGLIIVICYTLGCNKFEIENNSLFTGFVNSVPDFVIDHKLLFSPDTIWYNWMYKELIANKKKTYL